MSTCHRIAPDPQGRGRPSPRAGRALLHAQLRHGGLTREAIVPVSAGLLADTDRYFRALTVYRDGEIEPIVSEVAQAVFPALANARQLVADVTDARAAWGEAIRARRGAAAWALADPIATRPVIDTRLATAKLQVIPANAQLAIDRLVEDGVLEQVGNGSRDRDWQAPEILAAMDRFAARSHRRFS